MNEYQVKTDALIEKAFISLCYEKGSTDVSVSSIVARANIGRSTFYTYYEDIYELIEKIQERLLNKFEINLSNTIPIIIERNKTDIDSMFFRPMAEFLKENREALLIFMGRNGSAQFIYKVKKIAKSLLRQFFFNVERKHTDYLLEFMTSASIGLIVYWLEKGCDLPLEYLAKMMAAVVFDGIFAAGNKAL